MQYVDSVGFYALLLADIPTYAPEGRAVVKISKYINVQFRKKISYNDGLSYTDMLKFMLSDDVQCRYCV